MTTWLRGPILPPGLREFAVEKKLSDVQTKQLADMWGTIRGKKPMTVEEWRELYTVVEKYLREQSDTPR
jgi:hypothetical protein